MCRERGSRKAINMTSETIEGIRVSDEGKWWSVCLCGDTETVGRVCREPVHRVYADELGKGTWTILGDLESTRGSRMTLLQEKKRKEKGRGEKGRKTVNGWDLSRMNWIPWPVTGLADGPFSTARVELLLAR